MKKLILMLVLALAVFSLPVMAGVTFGPSWFLCDEVADWDEYDYYTCPASAAHDSLTVDLEEGEAAAVALGIAYNDADNPVHVVMRWEEVGSGVWYTFYDARVDTNDHPDRWLPFVADTVSFSEEGFYRVRVDVTPNGRSNVGPFYMNADVSGENTCPVFTNVPDQVVREGDLLEFDVVASDVDGDSLDYDIYGALPFGASFVDGVFSWSPAAWQSGDYVVSFMVSDGSCASVRMDVLVDVVDDATPVVSLVAIPGSGEAPLDVSFVCQVEGGDAPFDYDMDYGTGDFSGVPDNGRTWVTEYVYGFEGSFVATCTVTDNDGDTRSASVGIDVTDNVCPIFYPVEDRNVVVGETLDFTLEVFDADGDSLEFSVDMPFASYVDPVTGEFSFAPFATQVGSYDLLFRVSDGVCEDTTSMGLVVLPEGGDNQAPEASFEWSPENPEVGENVTFESTSSDPDGDALTCEWDFDADGWTDSTDCTAEWAFDDIGNYVVTLTVSDGVVTDSLSATVSVVGVLEVEDVECFTPVIAGDLQACSVTVGANDVSVGSVTTRLFYEDGTFITSCVTDVLTGRCVGTFAVGAPGNYTVYATAQRDGWVSDLDSDTTFTFEVLELRYRVPELNVYSDPGFSVLDNDFFRGEDMYVNFLVVDERGNPADSMVTSVALVSPPGGMAYFVEFPHAYQPGYYWYSLDIPVTHDFLGDSHVFAFAFNFTDGSGGQMMVNVVIRNNLPVIDAAVADEFDRVFDESAFIDLSTYGSDIEDSASDLRWDVFAVDPSVVAMSVSPDGMLMVNPVSEGRDVFTLILTDLDGDSDMVEVTVQTDVNVSSVAQCSDGLDNDGDGLVDMADPGCSDLSDDDEFDAPSLPQCSDGLDNDGDGLVDLADPDCVSALDNDESGSSGIPECMDGLDNDGDGFVDMADPDCSHPFDDDESGSSGVPECMDKIDNDGDGFVDLADPHCHNAFDDKEGVTYVPSTPDVFRDRDDLVVTRIDIDGFDIESALTSPGDYFRLGIGLYNNLDDDLDDVRVDVSVWELDIRASDMLSDLDSDESATVVLNLDIPYDVEPGLYDLRVVVSNDDVRRVKYRTIAVV
ncbi:PKD domain-containing protein [Candidatus Woesearchaeota archaeon]|nr:PKD domain-containing protein [Candidatus Woesearchaeota archaeon]